jgi:hypothetical protein
MRFDRALGHVQIPRNFRVVASLEQKLDDLLFPPPQLAELLVHLLYLAAAHGTLPVLLAVRVRCAPGIRSCPCLSIRAAKSTENR